MCCRSFGSASTVAGTKPRLMNQCAVRVVSTNSLLDAGRARAVFHVLQHAFAVALRLHFRVDRQASHFGHLFLGERVQRGAAEDHAVVLDDGKIVDLAFDQFAPALDQRAVGFQRFDQLDECRRRPRSWPRAGFPGSRDEIMVPTPSWVNSSSSAEPSIANGTMWARGDAAVAGLDRMPQVERRVRRQEAGLQHGFGLVRRQFADFRAGHVASSSAFR